MVGLSIIRYLLSDTESLSSYYQAEAVSFEDLRRRLLLLERNTDKMVPDQFYRLKLERDLYQIDTLSKVLLDGLYKIAEEYLCINDNVVYIKYDKQNEWQDIITFLPPLLLKMVFIYRRVPLVGMDKATILDYFTKNILPNTIHTCLPSVNIPQLNTLISSSQGLCDLHIHLNGSTETDIAWQDILASPEKIYGELKTAFRLPFVKEQLEQESILLGPEKFYSFLKIARRIRSLFFKLVFPSSEKINQDIGTILREINLDDSFSRKIPDYKHPFSFLIQEKNLLYNKTSIEGLMFVLIFDSIRKDSNSTLANLFHYYLLILGLTNRLLVQQVHQKGFQQFQKITLNNLREYSEIEYHTRFFQMHGNEKFFLNFLEGRFSPKKTEQDNIAFIESIYKGWNLFKSETKGFYSEHVPELKLVAHFIKRSDDEPDLYFRHKKLRFDTYKRGQTLFFLIKKSTKYNKYISGIDAAASEFDTPPEVFSPTFRYLREKFSEINKEPHFTYHVGEDFYHLIDGMRAIYEAIEFLPLSKNDRIGHGTALGIKVDSWRNVVNESILMRKGEWLDNLVFMWSYTKTNPDYSSIRSRLEQQIKDLANSIYGSTSYTSIADLEMAWLSRKYCPILLSCANEQEAKLKEIYNPSEWELIQTASLPSIVKNLILLYHRMEVRKKYNVPISINVDEIFSLDYLQNTQKEILKFMAIKEIIIETLPTSNRRIGNYKKFEEYHLNNWIELQKSIQIPQIVIGTDDTGIFATNIYNEYANLWQYFRNAKNKTDVETLTIINEFNKNSDSYKFTT